ncbi:hypothetical protein EYF80_052147 [Liparis tanakae]|uniref:Uncharacterized protein n=1 Tax=Liparis tanakae TaxID=230148 RepID=A0A4Z2F955_9TELE|nr:hypothetical protein EYF80_052147 [Liparis tanakae]
MEPEKKGSSFRVQVAANQSGQSKPGTGVCSRLGPERGDRNSSGASQQALTQANPSLAGTQCARHADALWPNNRLTRVSRSAAMPLRCQPAAPRPKTFHHPQREKNTKTQRKRRKTFLCSLREREREKGRERGKKISWLEKFCWSVMSGPGSASILKLCVLFCCSRRSTSDLAEGKNGWSGGLRGPVGLWVLDGVWRLDPEELRSSTGVSMFSAEDNNNKTCVKIPEAVQNLNPGCYIFKKMDRKI